MSEAEARVVRIVDETSLIINVGYKHGINAGDEFNILGVSDNIIDPQTFESLGDFYYEKDVLEVVDVKEKYSVLAKPQRIPSNPFGFDDPVTKPEFVSLNIDLDDIDPLVTDKDLTIRIGDYAEIVD